MSPKRESAATLFLCLVSLGALGGCKRIATYALDKELGDDGGLAALESSGSGSSSTTDACKLITTAEVEAATGQKVVKTDGNGESCTWGLSGGAIKGEDGSSGSINLQIAPELAMKVVPMFGQPKEIPGLGDKAEWVGNMAPNLRVHKNGKVLNFLLVDPGAMMQNTGITETPIATAAPKKLSDGTTVSGTTSAVNMEYPVLEKEAIALAKAALTRY